MKTILSALFFILLFTPICQADEIQDATKEYCACAEPMIKEANKMQASMKNGNMADLQQMSQKMQEKIGTMEGCFKKLEKKFAARKDDKAFSSAIEAEIQKQCPPPKFNLPMPQQ